MRHLKNLFMKVNKSRVIIRLVAVRMGVVSLENGELRFVFMLRPRRYASNAQSFKKQSSE